MQLTNDHASLHKADNLQDFFREELEQVVKRHQVEVCDDTLWYITQLLYNFRRSEQFFDYDAEGGTLTP